MCIVLSFCIRGCDIQGFWGVCVCVRVRACVRPRTSPSIKRADCSRVVGTQVIGGFSMAGLKVPNSWAVQGSAVLPMSALNMN